MGKLIAEEPHFLKNTEWYFYDYEKCRYELTDKATEEAKESYKQFYKTIDND